MADKRCENGHFIDESWDICPYCPPSVRSAEIPVVRPRRQDDEYPHRQTEEDPAKRRAPNDPQRLRVVDPEPEEGPGPQRTVAAAKLRLAGGRSHLRV